MKPAIIYDDQCELCKHLLIRLRKKAHHLNDQVNFIGINDVSRQAKYLPILLTKINKAQLNESIHFIDANGKIYQGFEAIQQILKISRVFLFLSRINSNFVKKIMNLLYKVIARIRKNSLFQTLISLLMNKI